MKNYDYRGGLEPIIEGGHMVAIGTNVIVRAIMATDASPLSAGVAVDTQTAIAHELVSAGSDVPLEIRDACASPEKWHCFIRTKTADRLAVSNRGNRYWALHWQDIRTMWPASTVDAVSPAP